MGQPDSHCKGTKFALFTIPMSLSVCLHLNRDTPECFESPGFFEASFERLISEQQVEAEAAVLRQARYKSVYAANLDIYKSECARLAQEPHVALCEALDRQPGRNQMETLRSCFCCNPLYRPQCPFIQPPIAPRQHTPYDPMTQCP